LKFKLLLVLYRIITGLIKEIMKNFQKIIAEAVRIEFEQNSGNLFIVFKITDEKYKQDIKTNWTKDIEYKLIDKFLVKED